MSIITSLLDNDFYNFTMLQAVIHQYPAAIVKYAFKWRNWDKMNLRIPIEDFAGRVKKEIDALCELRFTGDELFYLTNIPYFKPDFIESLELLKLNRKHITVYVKDGMLRIGIEGPWSRTILFETPVLSIVSQLYTENSVKDIKDWHSEGFRRLNNKLAWLTNSINELLPFRFADFGARRRAHALWQDEIIATILESPARKFFVGTSNVMLAKKYGVTPIGTISHQWIQGHQQLGVRLADSQKAALQAWANEYRGELGIALSDTLGFEAFLKDFDRYFALLFDGCRQDSGDPVNIATALIKHYKKLRIDPRTKHIVFSDGLDFEKAVNLCSTFRDQIKPSAGIGTHLTNDCGFLAPQIVIKMVECNGGPIAKVPDSGGKGMCEDAEFENHLKKLIAEKVGEDKIKYIRKD